MLNKLYKIYSFCLRFHEVFLYHFLLIRSNDSHCLDDPPTAKGPTQSTILRQKYPGEIFDANEQCEIIFGVGMKQCSALQVCFSYQISI